MSDPVGHLDTPAACEQFALNVEARGKPALAVAARRRAVELRAASHGAISGAEREALQAVYAYERTLLAKHGKATRASRTWQMIKQRGILPAVEHIVTRNEESLGYAALEQMGMRDMAFEAVVLRHPHEFSSEAVRKSRERLGEAE
jgi:hypothetical protein